MLRHRAHTCHAHLGKLRHKHPTHAVLSVNSFHSTECVSTCTADYHPPPIALPHFLPLLLALSLSHFTVMSVRLMNWRLYIKEIPWPSPQLIRGAKHAGSKVAVRASLEDTAIGPWFCMHACVFVGVCVCTHTQSADVHFGVFRDTDSQAACVGRWIIW